MTQTLQTPANGKKLAVSSYISYFKFKLEKQNIVDFYRLSDNNFDSSSQIKVGAPIMSYHSLSSVTGRALTLYYLDLNASAAVRLTYFKPLELCHAQICAKAPEQREEARKNLADLFSLSLEKLIEISKEDLI
jgi:hypothetical protein